MGKKIYVGNLPYSFGATELEQLFSQYGAVRAAQVISDRETGRSRGFGFVEMESSDDADAAIAGLNGQDHNGRKLTVNEARERTGGEPLQGLPRTPGTKHRLSSREVAPVSPLPSDPRSLGRRPTVASSQIGRAHV